jgi:hypothetical protein
MPFTELGWNQMLDAHKGTNPTVPVTHLGLLTKGADITAVTSTGSPDTFTKTAHGLANGDLVVASAITGGTGLIAGNAYFVISTAANTFQLALRPAGSAIDLSADLTSATFNKLTEVTGGSPAYARKAIAFAAAAGGISDDTTNGAVFDVPAGTTVAYTGQYSALTAGTLVAFDDVTPESYAAQGTYTATDVKNTLQT